LAIIDDTAAASPFSDRVRVQCDTIVEHARLVTGAARTILVLYDEATGSLVGAATSSADVPLQQVAFDLIRRNYPAGNPFEASYRPNVNPVVAAAFVGQHTQVSSLEDAFAEILPPSVMTVSHALAGISCVVDCPVMAEGRALGLIRFLVATSPTDSQQALMEAAAGQVGLTLLNAELADQSRRQLAALQALSEVARLAVSAGAQPTLEALVTRMRELTDADMAVVYLFHPGEDTYEAAAESLTELAREKDLFRVLSSPRTLGAGLVGWVIASGEAAFVPDVRLDPRTRGRRPTRVGEAAIVVPMREHSTVIGCLRLSKAHPRRFRESDLWLAQLLADQAAQAIELARDQERARAKAFRRGARSTTKQPLEPTQPTETSR
jgi:GAF domain-containing protein